jgi:hypothetical protein
VGFIQIAKHGDKTPPFLYLTITGQLKGAGTMFLRKCLIGSQIPVKDTKPQVQGTSGHLGARIREPGTRIRTKYHVPRNQEKSGSENAENLENRERLKLQSE